jgi:hypothetical protein
LVGLRLWATRAPFREGIKQYLRQVSWLLAVSDFPRPSQPA